MNKMAISENFKTNLHDLIILNEHSGTNHTILAKSMNIDYRTFSNAFNYGIIPKPISLSHIADFFGISIEYLLGETDDEYFEKAKIPSDFHTRFEKLRGTTSYYEIAKTCDFDKSMCSKWKTKKHIPSLDILRALAKHFNVSMDYLLGRTDEPTPYDDLDSNK